VIIEPEESHDFQTEGPCTEKARFCLVEVGYMGVVMWSM